MRKVLRLIVVLAVVAVPMLAQGKRLWVLRASGEMVEYDPTTFAAKQPVKVPPEAAKAPANISVNRIGQILFVPAVSLPLSDEDASSPHKIWLWNGHSATTLDQDVKRKAEERGSNQEVTESAAAAYLSANGKHLFWFANEARRLQREEVDLSTTNSWQAWQTDLAGAEKEEVASGKFPDCRCPTGTCEESCASGAVWVPEGGIDQFFLVTQYVAGQTTPSYKATTNYRQESGKWVPHEMAAPLQRLLDEASGTILEAIPDTGCCGWSNQSDDQTLVVGNGKSRAIFDEQATYKNPDYDVSFYTSNAGLSPQMGYVAMTVVSTASANKPIQLSQQGEADPEEAQRIRKALTQLPAVAIKTMGDPPKQVGFLPHAVLVGWISEGELLIIEDHVLVVYSMKSASRRKSRIRVEDAAHVFLR